MINENRFARSFTSFWTETLPTGKAYVHMLNLSHERFGFPLDSDSEPLRRGLINEIGFRIYKASLTDEELSKSGGSRSEKLDKVAVRSWEYIRKFRKQRFSPYYITRDIDPPTGPEKNEAVAIAKQLKLFFEKYEINQPIIASPQFPGCGIIEDSEGDIIAGKTLYEIKGGERSFRLIDIRQLLVYLALNQLSARYDITSAGLLNPRMGVFVRFGVDDFAREVSGKSKVGLLSDIIQFTSSGDVSR